MTYERIIWTEDDSKKMGLLQGLGESVAVGLGRHCGPIGARHLAVAILNSDKAGDLAELLPWLLTRELVDNISELEDVVSRAIMTPAVHATLKPILPGILKRFVYENKHAEYFLPPAYYIAKSKDQDFIDMALPHFSEALRRASWAPQNFGNLACAYLDIGGDPQGLVDPVKIVLSSQQDDPEGAFCRQNKEVKLAKHLCWGGFIRLLNHPRVKESKPLTHTLQPFAGEVIWDDPSIYPVCQTHIYILACIQGKRTGFAWAPSDEYARYVPMGRISNFRREFIKGNQSEDIAEIVVGLFEGMSQITNNSDVSVPAHRALKEMNKVFAQPIRDLAERREKFRKTDAELVAGAA